MWANDGVPSVMTIASAWAASVTRDDHSIFSAAVTRASTASAPGSSNGIRPRLTGVQALAVGVNADCSQALVGEGKRKRQAHTAAANNRYVEAHRPQVSCCWWYLRALAFLWVFRA